MYHVGSINIKEDDPLFAYLDYACLCANNMYNTANFYIRNLMTGLKKAVAARTGNEKDVIASVAGAVPEINSALMDKCAGKIKKILDSPSLSDKEKEDKIEKAKCTMFSMPDAAHWFAGYGLLDAVFRHNGNADYNAHHSHLVQDAIKECIGAWISFFKQPKEGNGTGKKKIPGYKKSGGRSTATFSNIACYVKDGMLFFPYATLPGEKKKARASIPLGALPHVATDKLVEVRVVPYFNMYRIQIVTDDGIPEEDSLPLEEGIIRKDGQPEGVMMLDPGLTNFATITDNKGNVPIAISHLQQSWRSRWWSSTTPSLLGVGS